MAELYARRWEHELYYRELKRVLRKNELLQSHTAETAAQEIAACVLASALIARERVRAAAGEVPVLSISFARTLELLRPLWIVFALGEDIVRAAKTGIDGALPHSCARLRHHAQAQAIFSTSGSTTRQQVAASYQQRIAPR